MEKNIEEGMNVFRKLKPLFDGIDFCIFENINFSQLTPDVIRLFLSVSNKAEEEVNYMEKYEKTSDFILKESIEPGFSDYWKLKKTMLKRLILVENLKKVFLLDEYEEDCIIDKYVVDSRVNFDISKRELNAYLAEKQRIISCYSNPSIDTRAQLAIAYIISKIYPYAGYYLGLSEKLPIENSSTRITFSNHINDGGIDLNIFSDNFYLRDYVSPILFDEVKARIKEFILSGRLDSILPESVSKYLKECANNIDSYHDINSFSNFQEQYDNTVPIFTPNMLEKIFPNLVIYNPELFLSLQTHLQSKQYTPHFIIQLPKQESNSIIDSSIKVSFDNSWQNLLQEAYQSNKDLEKNVHDAELVATFGDISDRKKVCYGVLDSGRFATLSEMESHFPPSFIENDHFNSFSVELKKMIKYYYGWEKFSEDSMSDKLYSELSELIVPTLLSVLQKNDYKSNADVGKNKR